jgi:hypothetical protein
VRHPSLDLTTAMHIESLSCGCAFPFPSLRMPVPFLAERSWCLRPRGPTPGAGAQLPAAALWRSMEDRPNPSRQPGSKPNIRDSHADPPASHPVVHRHCYHLTTPPTSTPPPPLLPPPPPPLSLRTSALSTAPHPIAPKHPDCCRRAS